MKLARRTFLHLTALTTAIAILSVVLPADGAWSQTAKTIKIVAPTAPGGVGDTVARLVGEQIGRVDAQSVLIENRTGAGGVIAADAVSRAAPAGGVRSNH